MADARNEQNMLGYIIGTFGGAYLFAILYFNIDDYGRHIMSELIFGLFFLALFFHAVQWNLQIKALGGKPLWFKIFKKSQ